MNCWLACCRWSRYWLTEWPTDPHQAPMQIFHSFAELKKVPCPVHWAMGFFDGVHRGHKRVIDSAASPGAMRGVLTFQPHPLAVLNPQAAPALLTPDPDMKAELLSSMGVELLLVLPFNTQLAALSPQEFLNTLLGSCSTVGISVGNNWHFGKGGSGNADFLRSQADKLGFTARINDMLQIDGDTVCSTRIRHLLAEGNIELANAMLGRNFTIRGTVEHGQKLARTLGFPTANITLPPSAALPRPGVYKVQALIDGRLQCGIANVGLRPTICEDFKPTRLETHFINWSGNLYGKQLDVQLLHFIRPEQKFNGIDALKSQIERDIATVMPHL